MSNPLNQSLNLTTEWFVDLGNSQGILSMIQHINNDMSQIPALLILLVIGFVITVSLTKDNKNVMNAITSSVYVVTITAVFFRILSLIGDKVLIGAFVIMAICIYIQVAHKPDFE